MIRTVRWLVILGAMLLIMACDGNSDMSGDVATTIPEPATSAVPTASPARTVTETHTLEFGGRTRSYIVHRPGNAPPIAPLVVVLHGGGGAANTMANFTGMSRIADREGFIAVYPDGVGNSWNDGRGDPAVAAERLEIDDVGFLSTLVDEMVNSYGADPNRIFVTGISNGGFMSERVACELSGKIAAIASIAATMGTKLVETCKPTRPVPVMLFNGDADPLVPYEGGFIQALGQTRVGEIISVAATVAFWTQNNGCSAPRTTGRLPDLDPNDQVQIRQETYAGCKDDADVVAFTMEGGGHVWPGGIQYLPVAAIGHTTKDIDASELMWAYFKQHPLR